MIKKQLETDKALLAKSSLAIDLVPEREEDVNHAAIIKYGSNIRLIVAAYVFQHADDCYLHIAAADDIQAKKQALQHKSIFARRASTSTSSRPALTSGTPTNATLAVSKRRKLAPEAAKRDKALRHSQHLAMLQSARAAHCTSRSVLSSPIIKKVANDTFEADASGVMDNGDDYDDRNEGETSAVASSNAERRLSIVDYGASDDDDDS